jgi:Flp pilus assembly protein TadG
MEKFKLRLNQAGSILTRRKSGATRLRLTRGQAMVEFAMTLGLFFLVLFAVIDYGWLLFAQMNIQQAVQDGGRYASTGDFKTGSSGKSIGRILSIEETIQNEISIPGVDTTKLQVSSMNSKGVVTSGSAGGPGDVVTVTLVTPMSLLAPLNFFGSFFPSSYAFTSSATFKNEPFDPANTN